MTVPLLSALDDPPLRSLDFTLAPLRSRDITASEELWRVKELPDRSLDGGLRVRDGDLGEGDRLLFVDLVDRRWV